jgi:hypothetical protein
MEMIHILTWDDGRAATPIGYITEAVFNKLAKIPTSIRGDLEVRSNSREISIFQQATEAERSKKAAATADFWRMNQDFRILSRWRNEPYPAYSLEMSCFTALKDQLPLYQNCGLLGTYDSLWHQDMGI